MPDHLHVLATLSGRLSVGQVIGKFKVLAKPALALADIRWQENFHEHRLRPEDVPGNYARYIFLNPYREKLISRCEDWPFWSKAGDVDFDFIHQLDAGGRPPEEWLTADMESLGVSLDAIGEMQ
jgi:REP element-mobilizing transposase RayT